MFYIYGAGGHGKVAFHTLTQSGTEHAIALANGTVALDVALKALGVGQGDEVIDTIIVHLGCD